MDAKFLVKLNELSREVSQLQYSLAVAEAERDQYLKQLNEALKDNCMLKYRLAKQRKALEDIYRTGLSMPGGSMNRTLNTINDIAKQALEVSDVL